MNSPLDGKFVALAPGCALSNVYRYPDASPEALHLLQRMLAFFPDDRITAEEALAHPFFASIRRPEEEVGVWW